MRCSVRIRLRPVRMDDKRKPKILKLSELRARLPYISQSALSSILALGKTHDLPTATSRNGVRRATNDVVFESTDYGAIHQHITIDLTKGGDTKVEVQHPCAMLCKVCKVSCSFSNLIIWTLQDHPCSASKPWHFVLYNDEVSPSSIHIFIKKPSQHETMFIPIGSTFIKDNV